MRLRVYSKVVLFHRNMVKGIRNFFWVEDRKQETKDPVGKKPMVGGWWGRLRLYKKTKKLRGNG